MTLHWTAIEPSTADLVRSAGPLALDSLLISARLIPIAFLVPMLGWSRSVLVRLTVAAAMTAALLPALSPGFSVALLPSTVRSATALAAIPANIAWSTIALVAAKEVALGAVLGFVAGLPFYAAIACGLLMDSACGLNLADTGRSRPKPASSSPLSQFALLVAVVMFFGTGGHRIVLRAVAASYEAWPLAAMPGGQALWQAGAEHVIGHLIAATAGLLVSAVGMAAPVLAASFLSELAFALADRAGSRPARSTARLPVRALFAIIVLALAVPALTAAIAGHGHELDRSLRQLVGEVTATLP